MATSSQDQPTAANTERKQVRAGKGRLWVRRVIAFIVIFLIIVVTLVVLISTKILPPQAFAPLLTTLGPVFSGIGAFVSTTLSDKDFQEALRKWFTRKFLGDGEEKTSYEDKRGKGEESQSLSISGPTRNVFLARVDLTDAKEFYGRAIEREQLLSRTRIGASTSIIGRRGIGKSWLMTYLRLIAPQELGPNFSIGYVDATRPSTATLAGFCGETMKALGHPPYSLPERPALILLEHFVRGIVAQGNRLVLCIDEFEGLIHRPECDLEFLEGLRAITQIGLALIVVSRKSLMDIVSESTRTSPFFNVFQQLSLGPFDREDTDHFVQEKGAQAQFTELECTYVLECSRSAGNREQFPPLRLQLVGDMLWHEKYVADPVARQRYRPDEVGYWHGFKERVDAAYRGMVQG